ncbi:uncharacterized protein LOC119375241 [Rhipicephalus sanguineus]|uniref:uncharacterized protein LOC119375241 n=1 Tax=Rhipicephalus sanguineus TaxID=34632 RepID=UPI001893101E|nr:uncharacterized protein LOC119375241 [Rhipicephalus sanguineus]
MTRWDREVATEFTSLTVTDALLALATAKTVPECAPVEPNICTDWGNESGPAGTSAFAWNVAQQRCTRVSSDAYCVRGSAAGFFRDVNECSLACEDGNARHYRPASAEKYAPCTDVDQDAVQVRRCTAEDLLYPAYFNGTVCKEEHEIGQCRYHCRSASFQTIELCKETCLGKDKDGQDNPCRVTKPSFECRDELKLLTAKYDSHVRRCRTVQICLGGGYNTIEECIQHCGGKSLFDAVASD